MARADRKGIAFGYFFGQRVFRADQVELGDLVPEHAVLRGKFGDRKLIQGKWPIVGVVEEWDASRWSIPPLARVDEVAKRAWVSVYDDDFRCLEETEVDLSEASRYPYDRMMGAGALEIRLTKVVQALEQER
jgi:hypothetical protein